MPTTLSPDRALRSRSPLVPVGSFLGFVMAWMLAWAFALPHPGAAPVKAPAEPALSVATERPSSAQSPSGAPGAHASATAPAGAAQPAAAASRSCCAEDGQTCVLQLSAVAQSLAPDSRRARWLPPKDNFSSVEAPRRDRPPRMTT